MKNCLSIFLLTYMAVACNSTKSDPITSPPFTLTDTMMAHTQFAKATIQNVKSELKLYGKVTADNSKMSQVYPVVGGNVIKVNAELGDYVKQGQTLAVIRSSEVAGYENERMDANSDVALAEKNLQVAKDLFAGKLNSEKDVVAAEKELEKAKAAQQRINEVYNIYSLKDGAQYNVTAPISGFVIDKNITQNELLNSNNISNLFSIAQINEVWVLANVNESDIAAITQGMDASIKTISYPDRVFTGKVDRIFNILDPETKAMKVRIRIPNDDLALKPEMSATVTLQYNENKKLVSIPSSAVIFDKSKNWVLIYKDKSHIETRQVDVYKQVGDTTYIVNGLNENETVITQNQMLIYDALND
ncbi:efflux RND transporter periplasmic adaptor subunit [Panacibacter ginsenosidivorans]|uniref:Efflux RND transporter periplasmic adaptor subunit n=1 Tax=Panacibacter ginsenosidivorans TaxID=1813871 RepID=A0A5B8VD05_9BACT|nr:efflux RND transporter periplasmic adaptor subunit [Panacibacter ginsenosidivorans]QEC69417.1 efflux RND transporter periplasmic adaptor subunit [Panacibacter ginsenosidivorans]